MRVVNLTKYQALDGVLYDTEEEALKADIRVQLARFVDAEIEHCYGKMENDDVVAALEKHKDKLCSIYRGKHVYLMNGEEDHR